MSRPTPTKPVTPYQWVIGILVTLLLAMVSYIAVTKDKEADSTKKDVENEAVLRSGRDESLQRQQSKTAEKLETLTIEFEKYKASHP